MRPTRKKAYAFLRWRKATHGIDSLDLRKEGRGANAKRSVRNTTAGILANTAEVDVAFRYNERTGRGDWR